MLERSWSIAIPRSHTDRARCEGNSATEQLACAFIYSLPLPVSAAYASVTTLDAGNPASIWGRLDLADPLVHTGRTPRTPEMLAGPIERPEVEPRVTAAVLEQGDRVFEDVLPMRARPDEDAQEST